MLTTKPILEPGFLGLSEKKGLLFLTPSIPCDSVHMAALKLIVRTIRHDFGIKTRIVFMSKSISEKEMQNKIMRVGRGLRINGCEQCGIITMAESNRANVELARKELAAKVILIPPLYDCGTTEMIAGRAIVQILKAI